MNPQGYRAPDPVEPTPRTLSVPVQIRLAFNTLMTTMAHHVDSRTYQIAQHSTGEWYAVRDDDGRFTRSLYLSRHNAAAWCLREIFPGEIVVVEAVKLEWVDSDKGEWVRTARGGKFEPDYVTACAVCPCGEDFKMDERGLPEMTCSHYSSNDGVLAFFVTTRRELES